MGDPPDSNLEVDHINHDRLDNRRENLRWTTRSQNVANTTRQWASSGYRGVRKRKYHYQVEVAGKYIGIYKCPIEAACAYDQAAIETYGDFAILNFPIEE